MALLVCAPLACGSLLGIDNGTPRGDASILGVDVDVPDGDSVDGTVVADGGTYSDVVTYSDMYVPVDSGPVCTPDLNWCETHCGTGPDNCGEMRGCGSQCPQGESCVANVCRCATAPSWCNGRCDKTTDNCGNPIDCMSCEGGATCYSNVCGCMPDPVTTTCKGQQCGAATNNCNLTVNCGVSNTTECNSGDYCMPDETCCTPDNSACNGQCQTSIVNNCGQTVPCPKTCPNNGVCNNNVCCTPTGCGGNCVDNCGQPNSSCCPAPPPDSGTPPFEAGGCAPPGAGCPAVNGCCQPYVCGGGGSCVSSCGTYGSICTSTKLCCYGLTCNYGGIITTQSFDLVDPNLVVHPDNIMPIDGGVTLQGTCQ